MPVIKKYTAIMVPHGLKRPGSMQVDPRKTAAKAGSRNDNPDVGSADPVVPAYITPPSALRTPDATSAPSRTRVMGIPLSRATFRPRPTKSSQLPTGVYSDTYQRRAQIPTP